MCSSERTSLFGKMTFVDWELNSKSPGWNTRGSGTYNNLLYEWGLCLRKVLRICPLLSIINRLQENINILQHSSINSRAQREGKLVSCLIYVWRLLLEESDINHTDVGEACFYSFEWWCRYRRTLEARSIEPGHLLIASGSKNDYMYVDQCVVWI